MAVEELSASTDAGFKVSSIAAAASAAINLFRNFMTASLI
jgi:hypothetical protein